MGDPIAEQLCPLCARMDGFKITRRTKQQLMEHLRSEIHNGKIGFYDPRLIAELENFEYVIGQSGTTYSAPQGLHDDGVIALALAAYCLHDPEMVTVDFWGQGGKLRA